MPIHLTKWLCCYQTRRRLIMSTQMFNNNRKSHRQTNSIDLNHSNKRSKTNRNSNNSQISSSSNNNNKRHSSNSSHRWTIFSNSKYMGSRAVNRLIIINGKTLIAPITICQANKCHPSLRTPTYPNNNKLWLMRKITIISGTKTVQTMSKAALLMISMLSFWMETTWMLVFTLSRMGRPLNLPHQPSLRSNNNKESPIRCCPWIRTTMLRTKTMQMVEASNHRITCSNSRCNNLIRCNSNFSIHSRNRTINKCWWWRRHRLININSSTNQTILETITNMTIHLYRS